MSIENKLDLILNKLGDLEERVERIEASCSGMDSHIGFVENVYGTLRSPLNYITYYINRLSGSTSQECLPSSRLRQLKQME